MTNPEPARGRLPLTPKLSAARQATLWSTLVALVLTGALWLWADTLYVPAGDGPEPHAIKHWAMQAHAAVALLFLFLAGTLLYTHMLAAWYQRRNRVTGALMAATALVLTVSGYGLWYFGGETLRAVAEWAHWITGFALPALLLWHARAGRKLSR